MFYNREYEGGVGMAIFVRERNESYTQEMLDPRNDFVFKMLFGQKRNVDLLLGLLSAILTTGLKKIVFINPYLEPDNISDKASVMDVRVETLEGNQINLEIQMQYHKAFPERMLMYWVRMHASQDDAGKELIKLQKSIQIVITNFSYLPSDEFHSTFHIIEKDRLFIYTDHLEMHVLEMSKVKEEFDEDLDELEKWILFLKGNRKVKEALAMEEPTFQKAYDELDRISHDKEMRARALSRDMFLKDQAQYRYDAREEGREEGRKEVVELLFKKGSTPLEISSLLEMPLNVVEKYLH